MAGFASAPDLNRLLRPRSIAVIGGSWSRSVIEQSQLMSFAGDIWPIHPVHKEICGLPAYKEVEDLPAAPDAVFVGVNRRTTIDLVSRLAFLGAGSAVCFASGFSEAAAEDENGEALQQQLIKAAGSMPVLGPNCYGVINYLDGALLWPDQHGGKRVTSGVALITQSSNIAINMTMQRRGLPIAYVMTAGNQAQTTIADMGLALLEDSRVTALGLHIEGLSDIAGFEKLAARAHQLGKGIVAIKVGRSVKAQTAMVSHTNSLSGSDAASNALFDRLGIARVDSVPVLLEALKLFHVFGPLPGQAVSSMSCSGGEAGLMADAVQDRDLVYPELNNIQTQKLRNALGPMVALANPLDYHTYIWDDLAKMTAAFSAMFHGDADLNFLVIDFPREDRCNYDSWMVAIDALIAARDATGARVALLATMHENMPEAIADNLIEKSVPCFCSIDEALDATVAAAASGKPLYGSSPVLVSTAVDTQASLLSEKNAKEILRIAGLPVPESSLVSSAADAQQAATSIGYPIVVKVSGVAHKTESGGVELNLQTAEDIQHAANKLLKISDSVLVEKFIDTTVAELLVGVVREPDGTFLLTLGAGGQFTELLRDSESLLLPVTHEQIVTSIGKLKVSRLLSGYRGKQGATLDPLVTSVTRLCDWVMEQSSLIDEVEINPLICLPESCMVADALIRMRVPQ